MRRTRTALGILAIGMTAFAVTAGPALAANGPGNGPGSGPGNGTCVAGNPLGNGPNRPGVGQGQGQRPGSGPIATVPSGTLTAAQRTDLAAMAEEEKLAHDLYVALAARYPALYQFNRIANAETQHLSAVQRMMTIYGIDDPTTGYAAGRFASASFQAMYDELLAGATTEAKALAAGIAVERADITDLEAALDTVTAPDVVRVYTNLLRGSQRHLTAFGG